VKVLWTRLAVGDVEQLRRFVAVDDPAAARDIATRILQAVDLLGRQPSIGRPGRVAGTRELVVTGTPYVVPYRVSHGRLEILRVLHSARKWPPRS